MTWIFKPIDNSVNRDNFDCGVPELNDYLKKYAKQNHQKGIAKTFVAIPEDGKPNVAGYYSVSMSEIQRESMPKSYGKGLPRYPVPAMRMGKLAVDSSMQGRKLGEALLMECLRRAIRLSQDVGIFAVVVDALNQEAKAFYSRYGFIALQSNSLSLFIPLKTVSKAME